MLSVARHVKRVSIAPFKGAQRIRGEASAFCEPFGLPRQSVVGIWRLQFQFRRGLDRSDEDVVESARPVLVSLLFFGGGENCDIEAETVEGGQNSRMSRLGSGGDPRGQAWTKRERCFWGDGTTR